MQIDQTTEDKKTFNINIDRSFLSYLPSSSFLSYISSSLYLLAILLMFLIIYDKFFADFLFLIYRNPYQLSLFYFKTLITIKFLIILIVLFLAFFGLSLKINYKPIILFAAYILYGFILILFDKFYLRYPFKYALYLFYRFYNLPVLILILLTLLAASLKTDRYKFGKEKLFKLWLIILFSLSPIILFLNIAQRFYSKIYRKNILPISNFNIIWKYGHTVIIFMNDIYYISLAVIMLSVLLFFKLKMPAKFILSALLLFTITVIYQTYFRTDYLGLILAIFSLLLLYFYKKSGDNKNNPFKFIIYALPAINLIIAFLLILLIVNLHIHGNGALNNSSTLFERLYEDKFLADKYIMNGNLFNLLFGHGIIKYGGYNRMPLWRPNIPGFLHINPSEFLFNNTYLQFALYGGLIYLIFFAAIFIYIWRLLLKAFSATPKNQFYFYAYVLTMFAAFPAIFMFDDFNTLFDIFAVVPTLLILVNY